MLAEGGSSRHVLARHCSRGRATIARERANKSFAKKKYWHAVGQLKPDKTIRVGHYKHKPPPNVGKHPGPELNIRVAASKKNVADLEYKKAMALEEASKVRAAILMKKALYAKKKDGRKTVRAARAARRDMKEAAVDQKRANAVFMREERKIRGADKKAERAISKS